MTALAIGRGEKFAAIAVVNTWLAEAFPDVINLGGGLWATKRPPLDLGTVWGRWLGDIMARELQRAHLWLIAKAASVTPGVIDSENEQLKESVGYLFHSLLLAHPLHIGGLVLRLNGGHDGILSIRGFEQLDQYFHTKDLEAPLDRAGLELARRVMDGLISLHASETWKRLHRGLLAFWRGLTQQYFEDRLHQFVRCLEGPIKPEIGSTRNQFVHRGQTFTVATTANAGVLRECFDIRSQVEHLHDWRNALANVSPGSASGPARKPSPTDGDSFALRLPTIGVGYRYPAPF